jgi:hypothetical protein
MMREQLYNLTMVSPVVQARVCRRLIGLEGIGAHVEATRRGSPSDLADEVFRVDAIPLAKVAKLLPTLM